MFIRFDSIVWKNWANIVHFGVSEEKEAAAAAARESTPEEERTPTKEEIHIAADHASKMTAKWEKIQQKEAKKAKKSKCRRNQLFMQWEICYQYNKILVKIHLLIC